MKIGVAGAGAIGCYFGGLLKQAGHDVTFLARGNHLAAMKKEGLSIYGEKENLHITSKFTEDPELLADSDLILLCVKSNDTEDVAKQLQPLLKEKALILTMQNGVDNEEILTNIFGSDQILSAATYVQAFVEGPGKVRQQGRVKLLVGELDSLAVHGCEAIIEAFQEAGIDTVHSRNILDRKWQKLLWNCTFNPLSAAAEARVGQILDDPYLQETAASICAEVVEVAIHKGVPVNREETVAKIFSNAERARGHQTSMLQDRLRGKRMEVESMCGYVVKQADDLGVEIPTLRSIYSILNFLNQSKEMAMKTG